MTQSIQPDFDSIRQVNPYGQEYWSARDLMPLLGYQKWENFNIAIKRAIEACENSGNNVADHFPESRKIVSLGAKATRNVKDYSLSRFACYLIALNGEPSKPEIATAQVYFAVAARTNELREFAARQNSRVELRERVAEGNKRLNEAALNVGVRSQSFGIFHDAGYRGLYGGLGAAQVKVRKHINPKEDLLDRAGLEELGANALRIGATDRKLRSGEVASEAEAIETHRAVGEEIRGTLGRLGVPMPENLPVEPSIKPLIEERKRARKKAVRPKGQADLFAETEDNGWAENAQP